MLTKTLFLLTLWFSLSYRVYASEAQCASLLLQNLTDKTQSSIVVALIKSAQILLDDANKYAAMQSRCPNAELVSDKPMGIPISDRKMDSAKPVLEKPMDCAEIKKQNRSANSGVYSIWPHNRVTASPINVSCDMTDDGGGWTVLQRRGDFDSGKDYFFKDWQSYKHGFGDPVKDFWLGNDNIFALTNQRVNVVKFTLTDWEGNTTYATFNEFWIDGECCNYKLHVSGYKGTAGDSFSYHDGQAFSTKDLDNDMSSRTNCAAFNNGAWWYNACLDSNLNGLYFKGGSSPSGDGIEWKKFRGGGYSLKESVIKIRPQDLEKKPR